MITRPVFRPRFSWESLRTNDDLGRVEGVIDESAVRAHAYAIGDDAERYLKGFGAGPCVPPSLVVNDLLKMVLLGYDDSDGSYGGLHTKAAIDYLAPVPIGEHVILTGTHVAKYARKGRRYRTLASQATGRDGTVYAQLMATETVLYDVEPDRPDEGEIPEHWAVGRPLGSGDIPMDAPRATPGQPLTPGMVLGPITRRVSLEQSVVFSGFPFSWAREEQVAVRQSLHTNPEIATRAGYTAPVAQGLLCAAHHTTLLLDHFGPRVFRGAQLALSFVAPVLIGTDLTSHAIVESAEGAQGARVLRLATKNGDGRLTAVGYPRG